MHRRRFVALLGSAITLPCVAAAQQRAMPVIGFLSSNAPGTYAPAVAAFRQGLAETGYIEGQNVAIEYRWGEDHYDRLPALAADLVSRKVDVIATSGGKETNAGMRRNGRDAPIAAICTRGIERAGSTRSCHFAPTRHRPPVSP
jgi:putative tryptophan/tyrosine transport system substrate-binding protein